MPSLLFVPESVQESKMWNSWRDNNVKQFSFQTLATYAERSSLALRSTRALQIACFKLHEPKLGSWFLVSSLYLRLSSPCFRWLLRAIFMLAQRSLRKAFRPYGRAWHQHLCVRRDASMSEVGSHTYRPCATVLRAIFLLVGILCGILCILWTQPRPLTAGNWVSNCWVKLKCRVWSSIHNSSALFSALPSGRPETTCSKAICLLKLQRTLFGQSETRRKDLFLLQFWSSLFPSLWSAVKEMFP